MPSHHEAQLNELKERLLAMASYAESSVSRAVRAVVERNDLLAEEVRRDDNLLDRLEVEIDDRAISLLTQAPLASELRLITTGMKISHDLERIGDEATKIARRALELNREAPLRPIPEVSSMASAAIEMLKQALDAFVRRHPQLAREVLPRDKTVDQLNKKVERDLVNQMLQGPDVISRCLNWMVVSKSLERIADHATNIAEEVVYLYEAKDIRHTGKDTPGKSPAA